MKSFFTKDIDWLKKWDDFLKTENRGNHLIYSDWLSSYKSYGFDFEVFIIINENKKIIGGFGAVIAKTLMFKFYIVPVGPIFTIGNESENDFALEKLKIRAKELNCCYCQFSFPYSNENQKFKHFFNSNIISFNDYESGNLFKYVYSPKGVNWVDFKGSTQEELLTSFSIQVRRNINLSLKNNLQISLAIDNLECQLAYEIIKKNAIDNNYSVRSFNDFGNTIMAMIDKKTAYLFVAKQNNEIKGSALVVDCGNHLTYISGGTLKEKPDLKIGYFLHWKIIEKSIELGYSGYNISLGGSKGVQEFKSKFNTTAILFSDETRHIIFKPTYFKLYLFLDSILKKNKKTISKFLRFLK